MELTKDSDKLACIVYKTYLEKRKDGQSKANAKHFNFDFAAVTPQLSKWNPSDIEETLNELKRANLIKKYIDGGFALQDSFIVYMENRFKNGLSEVLDFINKLIP